MIIAHIPSINGGAWNEFTGKIFYYPTQSHGTTRRQPDTKDLVKKQNRVTAIATQNKLPIIALVQSVSESVGEIVLFFPH